MSDDRDVLVRLRDVMARELETINQYELAADATQDPEAKTLFQHLADEEKEHVVEVFEALLLRDPAQKAWLGGAHSQAIREGKLSTVVAGGDSKDQPAVPAAAPAAASAPRAQPKPSSGFHGTFTIGSLLGQKQS